MTKNFQIKNIFQGKLFKGVEIVDGLTKFLKEKSISAGLISGIGAVMNARIGYYDQSEKKYISQQFNEPMEILSLKGNISLRDGEPFAHLHVVLSKSDFTCIGGHLFEATVFAFEFEVIEFEGKAFERGFDEPTGLFLWQG